MQLFALVLKDTRSYPLTRIIKYISKSFPDAYFTNDVVLKNHLFNDA